MKAKHLVPDTLLLEDRARLSYGSLYPRRIGFRVRGKRGAIHLRAEHVLRQAARARNAS